MLNIDLKTVPFSCLRDLQLDYEVKKEMNDNPVVKLHKKLHWTQIFLRVPMWKTKSLFLNA